MVRRRFTLVDQWHRVLVFSWSARINLACAFFAAIEAGISYTVDGRIGAGLAVSGASLAAAVARVVKQKSLHGDDDE